MSEIQTTKIKETIEHLEQRMCRLNQDISDNERLLEEKRLEFIELEDKKANLNSEIEKQIEANQSSLITTNKSVENLKRKKEALAIEVYELDQKISSSSKFLTELDNKLDKEQKELLILQKEKELARIIPEIKIKENLLKEIRILNQDLDKLEMDVSNLLREKTETENDLMLLKPSFKNSLIEQKRLQETLIQSQKQIKSADNLLAEIKVNYSKEKDILQNEKENLKNENSELKKKNSQIEQDNQTKLQEVQLKEKALEKREESLIFQLNGLLIREKKVKQREEAMGLGLEINQ